MPTDAQPEPAPAKPKRRWCQYGLATMFVVVFVICAFLATVVVPVERQRRAVALIEATQPVIIEYGGADATIEKGSLEGWLRRWLPQDYFDPVLQATILDATDCRCELLQEFCGIQTIKFIDHAPEIALIAIRDVPGLAELDLDETDVTDEGLFQLREMSGLRVLRLEKCPVTDDGIAHLSGMTGLRFLILDETGVTDTGLEKLKGLTQLETLSVAGTHVYGNGIAELSGLQNLELLILTRTLLSDHELLHLSGLPGIRRLFIDDTFVTDLGIDELRQLSRLDELHADGTRITRAGVIRITEALPTCVVEAD